MNEEEKVTFFAETDSRNRKLKFGIKQKDRSRHMYVIGKTGMGKSTLLENLAIQDIMDGNGIAFIDPHGKTADLLLEYIPKERINDVLYFAPFDMEFPVSFNVMEDVGPERRHLVANGLMSAFKKIWVDAWSARMEYILGNIMLALLEYPGSTLIGVNRMLVDKDYRKKIVDNITDPSVKSFWVDEYAKYTDKFAAEAAPAIQNKVGQFVANPLVRNIIGQPKSSFDIRKMMDEKKILIINLSKGRVGEANANLLGSMLITKIYLAAMSRADLKEKELKAVPHFYLYVDEFQSFANESFADILSEARKYKLDLTIAHQYIEQMSDEVRAAVFGNVGTMITFRVGAYDAEVLEKEYAPQFTAEDLVNLQKYQMYLKLMIDEVTSPPFSASGAPPFKRPEISYIKEIIDASRKNFARPRDEVEDEIRQWHEDRLGDQQSAGGGQRRPPGSSGGGQGYQGGGQSQSGSGRSQYSSGNSGGGTSGSSSGGSQSGNRSEGRSEYRSNPSSQGQGGGMGSRNSNYADGHSSTNASGGSRSFSQSSAPSNSPSNSSAHSRSPRDKENREADLRKAISLSYLKTEPEAKEVKNDQKVAKPENVAALRDALLAVMKDAKVDAVPASPASQVSTTPTPVAQTQSSQPVVSTQSNPQPAKNVVTEKPKDIPIKEQHTHHHQHRDIPKEPIQNQANSQKSEQKEEQKTESKHTRKTVEEVPEEILKKILNVDN